MKKIVFCTEGNTEALKHARNQLISWGYPVTLTPDDSVTHLLLPVPSIDKDGFIHGGSDLDHVIRQIPKSATILGGKLPPISHSTVDFLKDEFYLAENAAITAHCTVQLILSNLKTTIHNLPILIIGWGRIGKCLTELLQSMGAEVTLAVRNKKDMAILHALGYCADELRNLKPKEFTVICNTVPKKIMDEKEARDNAVLIDLATEKGIDGDRVIWARGIPNKMVPEASGLLIAKTALRYALRKE